MMAKVAIVAAFALGMVSPDVSSVPPLRSLFPTAAELHRALPAYAKTTYGLGSYGPCVGMGTSDWTKLDPTVFAPPAKEAGAICYGAVQIALGVWPTNAGAASWWSVLSMAESGWPPAHLTEHFPKAVHLVTIWDEVTPNYYSDWVYFSVGHAVGYVWITTSGPAVQPLTTLFALVFSKLPFSVTG